MSGGRPWTENNWLSIGTYSFVNPVLRKILSREPVTIDDLPDLAPNQTASYNLTEFQKQWEQEQLAERPSSKRIFDRMTLRHRMLTLFVICLWGAVALFSNAFLFAGVASFLSDVTRAPASGYMYAALMAVSSFIMSVLMPYVWFTGMLVATKVKSILITVVYDKATRLNDVGSQVGLVTNLMSTDAERVFDGYHFYNWRVGGPIVVCSTFVAIGFTVGVSVFPSIVILALTVPILQRIGREIGRSRSNAVQCTDRRMQLLSEILSSMLTVKIFAWEKAFGAKVAAERRDEIHHLKIGGAIQTLTLVVMQFGNVIPAILTIIMYVGLGNEVTLSLMMTTLALFSIMWSPYGMFSLGYTKRGAMMPSFDRLDNLLGMEDMVDREDSPVGPEGPRVVVDDASFTFPNTSFRGEQDHFSLKNINLSLENGVHMICGEVACGKSALLSMLIGTIRPGVGSVQRFGSTSFVPQDTFLVNDTLQQNILFGNGFDKERYDATLTDCCLLTDLEVLPDGDQTIIGERGVNLSGGQRARISLARAIYSNRDIIILDDFLSAVDARVGRKLVEILSKLRDQGKVVVFASHQMQYAHLVDQLLVMVEGKIVDQGSYDELVHQSAPFGDLMHAYGREDDADSKLKKSRGGEDIGELEVEPEEVRAKSEEKQTFDTSFVGSAIWKRFISEIRPHNAIIILFVVAMFTALRMYIDIWLTQRLDGSLDALSFAEWSGIWVCLSVIYAGLYYVGSIWITLSVLNASKRLFNQTFATLMTAPMKFFDDTPLGSILNRLGGDVAIVDVQVEFATNNFIIFVIQSISVLAIVAISSAWFLLTLPVLAFFLMWIMRWYRTGTRTIRRVDGATRGPLYSHVQQSMMGLEQLSIYSRLEEFRETFRQYADNHIRTTFSFWVTGRWFNIRTDTLASSVVALATFLAVAVRSTNPGLASLAIIYSVKLMLSFQWALRNFAELESHLTALERMTSYIDDVPTEKTNSGVHLPEDWPSEGKITFDNVSMRYGPGLPTVVNNVTFSLGSGEKLGVVGRTGAGKSSLIACFFRLVEIEKSGTIRIDGIDISEVPLIELRRRMSYLPQTTTLFSGTLRQNLDPFFQYTEEQLRDGLKEVEMEYKNLDDLVEEKGLNLSLGERQKVCIARAMIKKCKVLILDEATSSLSTGADALCQAIFERQKVTTISIAHRLHSVVTADKVMVLKEGAIEELGPPNSLLNSDRYTSFKSLVNETGKASSRYLMQQAQSHSLLHPAALEETSEDLLNAAIEADMEYHQVDL